MIQSRYMRKILPGVNVLRGFTLVELIVVVSVIAILSAMATVSFAAVQASARDADRKQLMTTIQIALERYYSDNQAYPGPGLSFCEVVASGRLFPNYLTVAPSDPCVTSGNRTPVCNASGNPNTLCSGSHHPTYGYTTTNGQDFTLTLTPESGGSAITFTNP